MRKMYSQSSLCLCATYRNGAEEGSKSGCRSNPYLQDIRTILKEYTRHTEPDPESSSPANRFKSSST